MDNKARKLSEKCWSKNINESYQLVKLNLVFFHILAFFINHSPFSLFIVSVEDILSRMLNCAKLVQLGELQWFLS